MSTIPASHNFARSSALMSVGTLLSRITGFGRIFALSYAIGFSRFTDTYNLANNVPNIIYELVVGGILAASLIPVFVRERTAAGGNEDAAWKGISAVATITACVVSLAALVLFFAAPVIIDLYTLGNQSDTRDAQRETATFLLRLFAPQLLFYGLISLATGMLNAHRRFVVPMFAPILNNLVTIAVLMAMPHIASDLSLQAMSENKGALLFLGLGTTLGVVAMAGIQLPFLLRIAKGRLRWNFDIKHEAVRTVVRMSGWTLGVVVTNQIALWITLTLANADPTAVSAFLSAYTFFILPHGIMAVTFMTIYQPEIVERWELRDLEGFRIRVVSGLRLCMFVMVPAGLGYAILAHPAVNVILLHGRMDLRSISLTGDMLQWMALGLPGFTAFVFLTRAFQSMTRARIVFVLYAIENGINVATAAAFWPLLGPSGLAISMSLSYAVAAVVTLFCLRRAASGLKGRELLSGMIRISLASAVMGAVVLAERLYVPGPELVVLVVATVSGALTFFAVAWIARLPEAREMFVYLRRTIPGRQ